MTDPAVVAEHLTITAAGTATPLLQDGSITLRPGTVTAITGESGSGKTTLLQAIVGYLPPGARRESGSLRVLGHDVLTLEPEPLRRLRRAHLAFVGQDPGSALNPTMRVSALLREVAATRDPDEPARVLERVQLPASVLHRRPGALSGGQQRRVALARALIRGVDVLLVDEPFAGLDGRVRHGVADVLRRLADTGVAVAVSGHDTTILHELADHTVHLGVPVTTRVHTTATTAETPRGSAVLSASGLGLVRGGRTVLAGVNLSVHPGEATAVLGESGAGKTTLARVLAGLEPAATGTMRLHDAPLRLPIARRPRSLRGRIQLIPQNPLSTLNPAHTVGHTLARPLRRRGVRGRAHLDSTVTALLATVGLTGAFTTRYPSELSGGQRQRISIARALAAEPDVLICDEVTSALDAATAQSVMDVLRGTMHERHTSLIVITHDLELAARYCRDVLVIDDGRVVESGSYAAADRLRRPVESKGNQSLNHTAT
ncbi:ABC transporter ATP-binding protein [Rhodococcus sp. MSC1_016]|jgi:peptide/nickel transport system ATP-binding protein|uniref:ABC transporter ATP-binding protein n=1 Tax=Rhodococcus sp. MSC1_016 TaxID=2909266 RepID=UPI0020300999|nr:ATP-binding cassette domain-containing protein [Rhodococcus sp. MSC1_016]